MPTACVFVQARRTQCISADPSPPSGLRWEGSYYYERFLPFGLRSSPAVFDSVATAVNWIMQHEFAIDHRLHYLDDFLDISTGLAAANQQLTIPLRAFTYLGTPLCSIPARRAITIIDLPWYFPRLRLPEDKLSEIRALLMATINERSIGQRQLESLLGKLTFAARVIVPGHTFMREL